MSPKLEHLLAKVEQPVLAASQQLVAEWLRRHGYGLSLEIGRPGLTNRGGASLVPLSAHSSGEVSRPVRFSLAHWPFCDNSVDLVVLHHCAAPGMGEALFREAVRVLRPEGRLMVVGFNAFGYIAIRHGLWWEKSCLLRGWVHALSQQQNLTWEQTLRSGLGPSSHPGAWDRELPWWLAPFSNLTAELFLKRRSNANVRPLKFRRPAAVGSPNLGMNRVAESGFLSIVDNSEFNARKSSADHRRCLQRKPRARRLGRHPEARSA